jgi:AraC family transcriptional regulator
MTDTATIELSPRFADGDRMRVFGLAGRYSEATRDRIPMQWKRLHERLGEVKGRTDTAEFGLCYALGDDSCGFEYVTGVMVGEDAPLPDGFVERRIVPRRHAVFTHRGDVSGIQPLVQAIFRDWLPRSGHQVAGEPLLTEVYGEDFDARSLRGVVEIWLPLA